MRIAIISDVHGNLQALEAVLPEIKKENPDSVIFLGDVVGYGANPNECCEIIKEVADVCIIGNHDSAVIGKIEIEWFNPDAREAILWTRENLKRENMEFIESFVETFKISDFLFSHGSPVNPREFIYVFSSETAKEISLWAKGKYRCVFVGHSHITLSFFIDSSGNPIPFIEEEVKLEGGDFVINVGSVGQPRDGDPRAFFAILDTEKRLYTARRVEYNVKEAADRILKNGLPPFLAYRLFVGE
jgi:putative phosphoesterase